jgi:polyisoprenoid-binding protein YceI
MALRPGRQAIGPDRGTLRVHTHREGVVQQIGHDLVIDVHRWEATLDVDEGGNPTAVALCVDPRSLAVREGRRGAKPLTARDREEIRSTIDSRILLGQPITFRSTATELASGRLKIDGELAMAGNKRPVGVALELSGDGRVTATVTLTQTAWGIKPYRAFMGALRVRDEVEVVLEANLLTS